jgi:amino acid adenylation domain-containing protein
MSPVEILLQLQRHGVRAWVEGGTLRLSPAEKVPAELRGRVDAHSAELLAFLAEAARAVAPVHARDIVRVPRNGPLPLSFAQLRFWFLLQLEQNGSAYNLMYVIRLRGPIDLDAVRWSFGEIVRRHEILRTTFAMAEQEPVQTVGEPYAVDLPVVDLTGHPQRDAEATRVADEEFARPFDPTTGPLLRAKAVRLGADDHLLLVSMLHLVSDGWSYGVLFRELIALYDARRNGKPSPLPELPVQYADYAVWQRRWYQRESARLLDYWRPRLTGISPLELPTDRPRPPAQTFGGARCRFSFPPGLRERIEAIGKQNGCTPFMTFLAAFDVLLARYAGQTDIAVGTPVANRARADTEGLIGLFLNTLVLRTDLSGDPTFRELLARTREVALGAFEHQEMPFEQLVVELRPERDLTRNPLFQVLFNVLYETDAPRLGGVDAQLIDPNVVTSMFDLSLILSSAGGFFEYNTDLFDAATIERMRHRFFVLLESIAAAPDACIWDLGIVPAAERAQLVEEPNRTQRSHPDSSTPALFAAQAAQTPDAVAAVCGDAALTYAELDARSNRLARHLAAQGAGRDKLVGLSVKRSLDMLVALLAIQKAGAAYVPLDPGYPQDRLAFICADAGIELAIADADGTLPVRRIVSLQRDAQAIAAQSAAPVDTLPSPRDLAYVIFTSGSTGKPKGVQIEHGALSNFLHAMQERPGFGAQDVLVAVTTISFDIAGLELYLPLVCGGRVVIATEEVVSDGPRLAELLARSGATVLQATPATWRLLLESGYSNPKLRALCGGEALPRELAEELLPRTGELWNMYGPTETTIWSLCERVTSGTGPVSIGKPIANTQVYVLDGRLAPALLGVMGKLYLGGAGLARGYWNRPELTAEKFIPHPFEKGARLYDTGDLARWRGDGTLAFQGRVDHQVKIRGFRIELGEIEHVLEQHAAVEACAVVAQTRGAGDQQLAAHVVLRPGASATVSELRKHLRAVLPDYMVPPAFVMLDGLPLTPNGKVDRKLLAQSGARSRSDERYVPPRTEMEVFIAKLWQEVLGVERVGLRDNFFDLGGHSLLALRVMFRIEKATGEKALPMELLIQDLQQFAAMCESRATKPLQAPAESAEEPRGVLGRLRKRLGRRGE